MSANNAPQDKTRHWAALTTMAGLVTLGVVIAFQTLPDVKAAAGCGPDHAVLHFELARTASDLASIFGHPDTDCHGKIIAAMDAINLLDVVAFIPAYTAFLSFAALFLSRGRLSAAATGAIALALIALAADYVETTHLLSYTPALTPSENALRVSSLAAWVKFAALSGNALLLAILCFTASQQRRLVLGTLLCLPAIGVALMAMDPDFMQAQTLSFFASWTPLVLMAAISATMRKRGRSET